MMTIWSSERLRSMIQHAPEASWPQIGRDHTELFAPSETVLIFWPQWMAKHCLGRDTSRT
ncbi:hypothetical protein BHE74_00030498 [Ensete ventricosum]|nr:hypothetical protein BHE74_00030498 [Ensete ventricosum]